MSVRPIPPPRPDNLHASSSSSSSSSDGLEEELNIYSILSQLANYRKQQERSLKAEDVVHVLDGPSLAYLVEELPRCTTRGRSCGGSHIILRPHRGVYRDLIALNPELNGDLDDADRSKNDVGVQTETLTQRMCRIIDDYNKREAAEVATSKSSGRE